jgi:hypothetical protein
MPEPFEFTTKCRVCTWHMQQGEKPAGGDSESDSNSNHVLASEHGRAPPAKVRQTHLSPLGEMPGIFDPPLQFYLR